MLSKTHVTDEIESGELFTNNYERVSCNSKSRHTGGVLIFL